MKIFSTLTLLVCLMCVTSVQGFFDSVFKALGIPAIVTGLKDVFDGKNVIKTIGNTVNQLANDSVLGQTIQVVHQAGGDPIKTVTGFINKTPTGEVINSILSAEQVSDAVPMEEAAPSPTPDIPDSLYVLIGKALFTMVQWVAMYWLFSRFIAIAKKSSTSLANEYTPIVDQEV